MIEHRHSKSKLAIEIHDSNIKLSHLENVSTNNLLIGGNIFWLFCQKIGKIRAYQAKIIRTLYVNIVIRNGIHV